MGVCQAGASRSNRAADGVEATGVCRDPGLTGPQMPLSQGCLETMGGCKQWKDSIRSRCRKRPPRSGGELTGKGKTGG